MARVKKRPANRVKPRRSAALKTFLAQFDGPPPGPTYCAKPVTCEKCPYPQACDAQTVRYTAD